MTLSRFGKRLDQVVAVAAELPSDPPKSPGAGQLHTEDGKWWVYSNRWLRCETPSPDTIAAYAVSQEAERFETYEKVAEALAKALGKQLRSSGFITSYSGGGVTVDFDAARMRYTIRVKKLMGDVIKHEIDEEELARNSTSVASFSAYMKALEVTIKGMSEKAPEVKRDANGWHEATGRGPARGFLTAGVQMREAARMAEAGAISAEEMRQKLGMVRGVSSPRITILDEAAAFDAKKEQVTTALSEIEEREAIESIKRALGGQA